MLGEVPVKWVEVQEVSLRVAYQILKWVSTSNDLQFTQSHAFPPMARPTTHLNLSSIYRWHEVENEKSLVYSLSPEAIQNGTIDPFILAATTLLHLLISASRRLLNTNISSVEYFVLLICIVAASVEEAAFLLLLIHGKDHTSPFFKTLNGFLFMFLNIVLHGIP